MPKSSVIIAKIGDVQPGKMQRIDLNGHALLLANVEGKFYVADDTCTHEDASLCTGSLKGELVKCPLHGSRFDLRTGKAMEDPAEEYLKVYPVTVEDDNILIEFE